MNIYETIVKKKFSLEDILIFILIAVGIIAVSIFASSLKAVSGYWLIITAVAVAAGFFAVTRRFVEFEYSIIDNEITIEKLINQKKRKRLLQIPIKEFEKFGRAQSAFPEIKAKAKFECYAASMVEEDLYFFVVNSGGTRKYIFFQPTEKMIEVISKVIPRKVV